MLASSSRESSEQLLLWSVGDTPRCRWHRRTVGERSSRSWSGWMMALGWLLLSMAGVQCFAISEKGHDKLHPRSGHAFPRPTSHPKKVAEHRWPLSSLTRLLAVRDEEENDKKDLPSNKDPAYSGSPVESVKVGTKVATTTLARWPCFDKLDKELIKISIPVIGNYAINPLIGAVDLFWVNRMGNALAVAGQAAANQVFSSAFWFTSFLPSGKAHSLQQMIIGFFINIHSKVFLSL